MDFIRFYGLVVREAFRHSLDIAQGVIFVLFIVAGLVVSRYPAAKMMIEQLNLGGWQVAALVFGGIIGIRLILAPYWVWRAAHARIVTHPETTIDYGFRLENFKCDIARGDKGVRLGFMLRNSLEVPIKYEVEDIYITVAGQEVANPSFDNKGSIVPKLAPTTYMYPWILNVPIGNKAMVEGSASITYKYGIAGHPFSRRAKYVCRLHITRKTTEFRTLEESEDSI